MENEPIHESEESVDITTQIASLEEAIRKAEEEIEETGSSSSDVAFLRDKLDNLKIEAYKEQNS